MEKCPDCNVKLKHYHGVLGYEALICIKCGFYSDVFGEEGKDEVYIKTVKTD